MSDEVGPILQKPQRKEKRKRLWEIKMFGERSERDPERVPMSDLWVLAIRTCLPNESETKSKFQLFSLLAYEETGQGH